jgi:hypothetical protein
VNRPGENKPPLRHVLTYATWEALVWQLGIDKHGENDWRREEIEPEQYIDAMARHLKEIKEGKLIDNESGLPHAAHIVVDAKIYGCKTEPDMWVPGPEVIGCPV